MTRTLLVAALAALTIGASAQCVPNQLYGDSVYGVWPDTTENFAGGMVGVFYSDTLQILVPTSASAINPSYPAFVTIDSVRMDQVSGLPPGISVNCNSQTTAPCTYLASQVGCGLLEGTPTAQGVFSLTIEVTVYLNVFGSTQQVGQSFGGYSITILPNTVGIGDVQPVSGGKAHNVPNPFTGRTSIEFNLEHNAPVTITVFNLVGKKMWQETVPGKAGSNRVPFVAGDLENGIYLFQVEGAGTTSTGRMVVNR